MDKTKMAVLVAIVAIVLIAAAAAALLLNKNDNGGKEEKVNLLTDTATGIQVYDGSFPAGTTLTVNKLSGSELDEALGHMPPGMVDSDKAVAYSVLTKCDGKEVAPEGQIEIYFPRSCVVESPNDSYNAFLVTENGSEQELVTVYKDNKGNKTIGVKSMKDGVFVISAAPEASATSAVTVTGENTQVSVNGSSYASRFSGAFNEGSTITVVAKPSEGYAFEGFYEGDRFVSASTTYTFTAGSDDVTLRAVSAKAGEKLAIDGGNSTLYVNGKNVGKSCDLSFEKGTPISVYAVADEGFVVTGWSGSYQASTSACDFVLESDTSLSVQTKKVADTVKFHATVKLDGEASEPCGSIVAEGKNVGTEFAATLEVSGAPLQISAQSNAGFVFDCWEVNGQRYANPAVTIRAGSDDMEAVAVFKNAPSHTVSASVENGAVSIDGAAASSKSVKEGTEFTVKAIPADGYRFVGWYEGELCVSTSEEYTTTMVQSDISLVGKTKYTQMSVDLSVVNGTLMVDGKNVGTAYKGTVAEGGTITVEAVPDEAYVFDSWTMNGKTYTYSVITIKGVSEDISGSASMKVAPARTLSASISNGTVEIDGNDMGSSGSVQVYDGKKVTMTAKPAQGYRFIGWQYDGKFASTNETYTVTINGDMSFSAVVDSTLHSITVKSENGTLIVDSVNIGPEYSGTMNMGESKYFNAAPNPGYKFVEWEVNGKKYGSESQSISITMGSEDIVAVAKSVPMDKGTIYIVAENGTVLVDNVDRGNSFSMIASPNQEVNLKAVPNPGYVFDHWTIDGERSDHQEVSITMGTEMVVVSATMVKETTHRVVASIDHGKLFYNGTDMGSSLSVDVPDMAVIKLRAEPAAGYALAGWYEDGVQPRFQTDIEFQVLYSTTLTVKTEPSK